MRRAFLLLVLVYVFFALTGDFSAIKRDFSPAEEATYIVAQRWEGATPSSFNYFRRFYPKGGRVALAWRGKAQVYSPWVYNAISWPFFRLLGERGLYLLNALLLGLSLWFLLKIFPGKYFPFIALLGSTLPVFLLLEGPHSFSFALASMVLFLLSRKEFLAAMFVAGILSFFSPPFFFFLPLVALSGGRKNINILAGFSSFFLILLAALKLPGSLPWDVPFMASLSLQASSFLTNPVILYSGRFPIGNFLVGRFTGALLYFPVLLLFLWSRWRKVLLGAFLLSVFLAINPVPAPFGFVGNPWLVPFLPFAVAQTEGLWKKALVILSILSVGIINIFPLRSTTYPLIFTDRLPFGWGKVEVEQLNTLPLLRVRQNFHLDRNFFWYKGNSLRPRGRDRVKFVRISEREKTLFWIRNFVKGNRVDFKVNGSRRKLLFKRKDRYTEIFEGKKLYPGIYLYQVEIKSQLCRALLPQKICVGVELWWK